jgi:nucleoside-diphosphate-sugar epimerase
MTTLITGADGYLGRRIAAALAGDQLILTVRAGDAAALARKRAVLARVLPAGRFTVVPADLRDPAALATVDSGRITRIVHAAAVTRFSVDRDTAASVNLAGTARVRALAERCPNLDRLLVLSTLYTAGRRQGEVPEERHTGRAGFVNHYEWSKWAAEEQVLDAPSLPVTVVRLPTVVADDDTGTVGQHNAFHHTLRLYYYGLLTLLPGDPATPLSLATAAFTVDAVTALLAADPGIYHASPDPVPLGTAVDTVFTAFERDPAFQRRMLPRPVHCDRDSFHDLVAAAQRLRGGPIHTALASVAPFAEQLYLPKVFGTDRFRAAWSGDLRADPVVLIESVCSRLVATRWGRRPRSLTDVPV